MEYGSQAEYEQALERGRKYFLCAAGLSPRQLKYNMDYIERIINSEQEAAYKACKSFVEAYFDSDNPDGLILIGTVGCGKTMLVSYIIHYLTFCGYSEQYVEQFSDDNPVNYQGDLSSFICNNRSKYIMLNTSYFLSGLRAHTGIEDRYAYDSIMYSMKHADVLILDDLGAEKPTEWTQAVLFEIIDYRYNSNLPIIITTNCLPEELKEKIGERSVDRLREMCKLVTINHSSFRKTAE